MKGTAKSKVVTSGRLTGGVNVQQVRRRDARATPTPGPAACPEPAYSLYSTDSEDQVTSLHKGLDRCAALLSGILQAENTVQTNFPNVAAANGSAPDLLPTLPSLPGTLRGGAAKSRPSTSLGKTVKKRRTKTDQKRCLSAQRGPGGTAPKQLHALPRPHLPSLPRPQASTSLPGRPPLPRTNSGCDGEEDEPVPVRDVDDRSAKTSNAQPAPGQEGCDDAKATQQLLGELKVLIAGKGSLAERLLGLLEQTVTVSLANVDSSNIQTEPDLSLHSQNAQLSRRVMVLNQQLKESEDAERQHNTETLGNSEGTRTAGIPVSTPQEELRNAIAELQKALQHTQSQLRDREAEIALIKRDLKATTSRLLDSEQEKNELASLAQQRLEEIENLNRILQSQDSSACPTLVDSSVSDVQHFNRDQHRQEPAESPACRIAQYLMSLGQHEALAHTERACAAAERDRNTLEENTLTSVQLRDTLANSDVRFQQGDGPSETSTRHQNSHLDQPSCLDDVQLCGRRQEEEHSRQLSSAMSQCDVGSDWSTRSGSILDPRDETAFRAGLAALDASIASLQKTIELDLGR